MPAYKKADGTKIDGKRVVVDYERGRTQKTWLPRRLGGGKGDTRKARRSRYSRSRSRSRDRRDYRSRSHDRSSRDRDRRDSRDDRRSDRDRDDRRRRY